MVSGRSIFHWLPPAWADAPPLEDEPPLLD